MTNEVLGKSVVITGAFGALGAAVARAAADAGALVPGLRGVTAITGH